MTKGWKWKLAVALAVVFLAGVTVGLFIGARHAHFVFMGRRSGQPGDHMRRVLQRELRLTPDQLLEISPIIDRTSAQLEALRKETGHRVSQAINQAHDEIKTHLTPEQQARLEEMKRRHQSMLRAHDLLPPPNLP